MAVADTAKLIASLELQDKMSAGLRKASGSVGALDTKMGKLGKTGKAIGVGLAAVGASVATGIGIAVSRGLDALVALESVTAQTDAALKSTGGAANVTAADVRTLAESMEDLTTIDDKVIQSAANMMLTFTNVRNEAGKGNDIFNQSIAVLADMSTALGTDMSQSAIQLGKALNDPVAGITALKRVGVTFDAAQMKLIKTLVKEGKVLDAQKLILAELNKEFGGSAAAQADTYAGKMRRLNDAVEGLQMGLAEALLPVLSEVSSELNTFLRDEALMAGVKSFGKDLAAGFREGVRWAKQLPWDKIGAALSTAAGAAKTLIGVFTSLPPEAMAAILALGGLNKLSGGAVGSLIGDLSKGLIKGVLGINAGVVNVNAASVRGPGSLPPVGPSTGAMSVGTALIGIAGAAVIGGMIAEAIAIPVSEILDPGSTTPERLPGFTGENSTRNPRDSSGRTRQQVEDENTRAAVDRVSGAVGAVESVVAALKGQTATGDERTASRIASLDAATKAANAKAVAASNATKSVIATGLAATKIATSAGLAATAAAANRTANVIAAKNMSPKVIVNTNVGFSVSVRAVTSGQNTVQRYTGGTSTSRTIL